MDNIGYRIRLARQELGISQNTLASALDIDRVSVTQWESGKHFPNPVRLASIAKTLEVSIEWLITGKRDDVTPVQNTLSPKESNMLELFRKLSNEDKNRIQQNMQDLFDLASLRTKQS